MKWKKLIIVLLLVPCVATAQQTPKQGKFDPRVRVVDYNPADVVKLSTFYGVSTHVQLGEDETIQDVAVGDDLAWKVVPRGNHLFIKPTAKNGDTNVTVITNRRTYQFALVVQPREQHDTTAWSDPHLIFSLAFRYPDEEVSQRELAEQKRSLRTALSEGAKEGQNLDYWVAGSEEISPTGARDDGRFIYLTFSNNRDMPAVYSVDAEGHESLINTNVDGNTIVVQRLVRQLVLRKGNAVASVMNKSFNWDGGNDNTSGTVSRRVVRVVKGAQR